MNFSTIINDDSKEFKYGTYDESYATALKPYITNLNLCKGEVKCTQALAMAKRLQQKCTEIALQTEDVIYQEFSYRAVTIAYMKAMVLYIANDMTWDKSIDEFCEWSLDYDLWCKNFFFGDEISSARESSTPKKRRGRDNMLKLLPDTFTLADAQIACKNLGKDTSGASHMLAVWFHRGYIDFNDETEMYEMISIITIISNPDELTHEASPEHSLLAMACKKEENEVSRMQLNLFKLLR